MRVSLLSVLAPLVFAGAVFAQAPAAGAPGEAPAGTVGVAVPSGDSHFTIVEANDGKTVGSADCSVAATPGSYQITSHGDLKMPKFTYTFANESRLDGALNIVHN